MKKIMFLMVVAMLSFGLLGNVTTAQHKVYKINGLAIYIDTVQLDKCYILSTDFGKLKDNNLWVVGKNIIKSQIGLNVHIPNQKNGERITIGFFDYEGMSIRSKDFLPLLKKISIQKEETLLRAIHFSKNGEASINKKHFPRKEWQISRQKGFPEWWTFVEYKGFQFFLRPNRAIQNPQIFIINGVWGNSRIPPCDWRKELKKLEVKKLN